jgi:raffinose/stachyose/melibiose transport system substrate-binding protein
MSHKRFVFVLMLVAALLSVGLVSAQEEVTLTFWFEGESLANIELFNQVMDRFEELNPGVTVEIASYPFDDFLRVTPLALDSGEGPDVLYTPWGLQALGRYALAGQIINLDEIAAEHGWFDHFDINEVYQTNDMTPGQIFGIPFETTTIGVYYNTEIFAELGLELPETLADFEAIMATIKDAGITPVSVGGLDAWPLAHVWLQLVHTNMPIEIITGIELNDPAQRLDSPEFLAVTQKVKEWYDLGYLDPNLLSTNFVDANNLFINGDVAMNIGGTWVLNDFATMPAFEAGFFPTPQMNPDLPWHAGGKNPYNHLAINAASEHQELAIELLDFLLGEEAQTMFWNAGNLVAYQFEETPPPVTRLQGDAYAANLITGFGYNIGITCSELNVTTWRTLQEMIGGEITPEEVIAENQRVFEEDCLQS